MKPGPAILVALSLTLIGTGARATAPHIPPQYAAVRTALEPSSVPVLLPMPIPKLLGTVRSVAVISADRNGYYVAFSSVAHCAGALSCASFHIAGSPARTRLDESKPAGRRVRLADGTIGHFQPRDCSGASCTEASLFFDRDRVWYELDVKAAANELRLLETMYVHLHRLDFRHRHPFQ